MVLLWWNLRSSLGNKTSSNQFIMILLKALETKSRELNLVQNGKVNDLISDFELRSEG